MSSLSNISNANDAQFGRFGTYNLSKTNPFYSTSLDATEVSAITADASGNITYTLAPEASADISEVVVGSYIEVKGETTSAANNGIKQITAVSASADQITVNNGSRVGTTVASAENTFLSVRGLKTISIIVQSDLVISSIGLNDSIGTPSTAGYNAEYSNVIDLNELVVASGEAIIALAPDYKAPNQG